MTDLPTTWFGRHANGEHTMMFGVPFSMRSHISAVSSQPSPIVLQSERTSDAFAARSKMPPYGSKRSDASSILLMGLRMPSRKSMAPLCVTRFTAFVPSSRFMFTWFETPNRKKSTRPGTSASQPSFSMTFTTWLFAVGWNFTRISPTTPTRGLLRSFTKGSRSNERMVSSHRR